MTQNHQGAIALAGGTNSGIAPLTIGRAANVAACQIEGMAAAGAAVEVFSDVGGQALFFEGRTTASQSGTFSLTVPHTCRANRANARGDQRRRCLCAVCAAGHAPGDRAAIPTAHPALR